MSESSGIADLAERTLRTAYAIPGFRRAYRASKRFLGLDRVLFSWRLSRALQDARHYHGPEGTGARILIINHYFDQDVRAILAANREHRILVLPHMVIRPLADRFYPDKVRFDWMNTLEDADVQSARAAYRVELAAVVDRIRAVFPFDVIVSTSFLLFWIRDLIDVVRERAVPWVMVDKEGTISAHYFYSYPEFLRERGLVRCDDILVWSERQRDFWSRSGVDPERIHLVGQARSDVYVRPELLPAKEQLGLGLRPDAPLLVFFTYYKDAYIPPELYERGEVRWDAMWAESHQVILDVAAAHPELDVVIKAHPQPRSELPEIRAMIERRRLPNVKVATGAGLANPLIIHADVIAGFQTTAMIESMIPRPPKPVVYLFWGDVPKFKDGLIPFHNSQALTCATSAAHFRAELEKGLADPRAAIPPEQVERRAAFVDQYFWKPDGRAGERTLAAIAEVAARARR